MKKLFPLFFFTLSLVHAQIKYEPGYITDHNGQKTEVLIENVDWKGNPKSINYKPQENAEVRKATTREIKEFEVGNFHYVATTVNVDQSSHITRKLSTTKNPEFKEETLFLRYVVKGPANLYMIDGNDVRYFYNKEGAPIEPLIYKRYMEDRKILFNNQFRQQLFSNLQCQGMDLSDVQNLNYQKNSLIKYFVNYNSCTDENYVFEDVKNTGDFNLNIKAGIGMSNLKVERGMTAGGVEMSGLEYRASVEMEYVFPFNRNKWAAYFEPVYRTFDGGEERITETITADLTARYTSVELGFGIRHYLFLNEDSKVFINLVYVYDIPVNSEVLFANTNRAMDPVLSDFDYTNSINLGVGYNFKNKYLIEAKYISRPFDGNIDVPTHYNVNWKSNYTSIILSLGYRLF